MASNNNEATPLVVDGGKSMPKKRRNQNWDEIKTSAFQIYMVEDNDLAVTMAKIETVYGFKARYDIKSDTYTEVSHKF